MKPKLLCAKCGADVQLHMAFCPSCGTALEWTGGGSRKSKSGTEKTSVPGVFPIRNVLILVVVIGAGAAVLEYATGSGPVPKAVQNAQMPAQPAATGANMAALPHIEELDTQLKSDPENQELRRDLANHLMDNRFYERAIAVYKDFLARDPKNADARVDMGICLKETGDLAGAQSEMTTALKYQPKHLHAHFNLGVVNLVQGNLEVANDWFRKTVALDPNSEVGKRAQQLLQQHNSLPPQ